MVWGCVSACPIYVDLVLSVFAPFSHKVEAGADHQEKPSILSFSPHTSNLILPPDFSISEIERICELAKLWMAQEGRFVKGHNLNVLNG